MRKSRSDERALSVPLLARGTLYHPAVIVPFVLAFAIPAASRNSDLHPAVELSITGALLLVAGVVALVRWLSRQWVQVTMDGFLLYSHFGREEALDEDVVGLRVDDRKPGTVSVALDLEAGGRPRLLPLNYTYKGDEGDPLGGLWKRLVRRLAERAEKRLDQRHVLVGEDWEVSAGKLHLEDEARAIDLRTVRKADVVEDELCLWVGDGPGPPFACRCRAATC